jgi:transposase
MTAGGDLSDAEWAVVAPLLPPGRGRRGRPPARDGRTVVDALLWLARNEAGWRSLPARYGPWNSVWRRVSRWGAAGLLDALPAALAASALDADRQAAIRAAVLRCRRGGAPRGRDRSPPGPAAPGDRRQGGRPCGKLARRGRSSAGAIA